MQAGLAQRGRWQRIRGSKHARTRHCIRASTSKQRARPPTPALARPPTNRHAPQGFGNVGAWAAEFLADHGGKVLAVSDVSSALANEGGLDVKALRAHVAAGKPLAEFGGGTVIDKDELLYTECED